MRGSNTPIIAILAMMLFTTCRVDITDYPRPQFNNGDESLIEIPLGLEETNTKTAYELRDKIRRVDIMRSHFKDIELQYKVKQLDDTREVYSFISPWRDREFKWEYLPGTEANQWLLYEELGKKDWFLITRLVESHDGRSGYINYHDLFNHDQDHLIHHFVYETLADDKDTRRYDLAEDNGDRYIVHVYTDGSGDLEFYQNGILSADYFWNSNGAGQVLYYSEDGVVEKKMLSQD